MMECGSALVTFPVSLVCHIELFILSFINYNWSVQEELWDVSIFEEAQDEVVTEEHVVYPHR